MSDITFKPDLAFLHLSDIHFRRGQTGDVHDTNIDLRNELERDLRIVRATKVSKLDGIIVSGDIAFGGHPDEYEYAKGWIERVRELVDCPPTGVMVTPGNHDIDRNAVPQDGDVDKLHDTVRAATTTTDRDAVLAELLRDGATGLQMLKSMEAYNIFAKEYGCDVTPLQPYWERDFPIANKASLKIRGMTSTLISGPRDKLPTYKMAYGGGQRTLPRFDLIFRMVVGHHPPSWTLEGDDAANAFSNRCILQLFGHMHEHWITPAGKGLRLISGAIHPDPTESQWQPRYSVIAMKLGDDGHMHIRIFPREWSREETTFIGDFNSTGEDYRDHVVTP